MTDDDARVEGTVAEVEAWWHTLDEGNPLPAAAAAGALADLFRRAGRVGADLHDPSAELLRWLTRDLARDPDVTDEAYDAAILTLPRYLQFLRAHRLWRRSEHAVRACWDVLTWARHRPLGLSSLGEDADAVVGGLLAGPPSPDMLAGATTRAYVGPLRTTLAALAAQRRLSRSQVAATLQVPSGSTAEHVWTDALDRAGLVLLDADGVLPQPEVTHAGGCPPPSTSLVERVIGGLVHAAIDVDAGVIGTLVETCTETGAVLPGASLGEALGELVRFGVLDQVTLPGGEALGVPEPLRRTVAQAVADRTGCVGTDDVAPAWQPVDLRSRLAADAAVDLLVTLEQQPHVRRRLRVLASQSLEAVHGMLQQSLGWRDARAHLFADPDGTRRFAPRWLLGDLRDDVDAAVTDADSAPLGAVLATSGAELVYAYGHLANPWLLRLRVERVTSGMKELVVWLDAEGDAPAEPTLMSEQLAPRLPAGLAIPAELERAWAFMESHRWAATAPEGHVLLAPGPPEARPGIVFSAGLGLDDRVPPVAAARLLPVAASPDDTRLALWLDDDGATRVVALGPRGEAFLLATEPADLLRLAAVGYPDLAPTTLGRPPASPDAVAGVAEFRAWVQGQLGLPVPSEWPVADHDRFAVWLASHRQAVA